MSLSSVVASVEKTAGDLLHEAAALVPKLVTAANVVAVDATKALPFILTILRFMAPTSPEAAAAVVAAPLVVDALNAIDAAISAAGAEVTTTGTTLNITPELAQAFVTAKQTVTQAAAAVKAV